LAICLGILAFSRPIFALATIVLAFGIYALVEGISSLVEAIRSWNARDDRWLLALQGVIGVIAGVITLCTPGITAVILIVYIAAWSVARGILRIVEGLHLHGEVPGGGWLVIGGVACLVFAMLVLMRPLGWALSMAGLLGLYALVVGATEVILAFKMRLLPRVIPPSVVHPPRNRAA
jgi:uncharacterized membrane protein HdeD (DUF308 family)